MVLLLLETFDGKRPRGRLVLVLLGELMDIRTVPVPALPMGCGGCTSRPISRSFSGSILAIFLSAQSAKSCLLFIITRARRRKVVRRELPKSEVECRTRAEVKSERSGGRMVYPCPASGELTQLLRLPLEVRSSSRHRTVRSIAGAIEVPPVSG